MGSWSRVSRGGGTEKISLCILYCASYWETLFSVFSTVVDPGVRDLVQLLPSKTRSHVVTEVDSSLIMDAVFCSFLPFQ